jgi:MoxR-like ATPase
MTNTTEIAETGRRILDAVKTVVVGMDDPLEIALGAILAGGHVLFEDVPGLGKTVAARSLAAALGLDFRRLQCTPDMLPGDVTGSYVYAPDTGEFVFRPGPIFTGLLLADEINRTTPKTQSSMLEAMAERQVTVEGTSFPLARPFHVIATSNPVEYEGTYTLPEAQLDRFMVRLSVGYPDAADEAEILMGRVARRTEETHVDAVIDSATLREIQAAVEAIHARPAPPSTSPSVPRPADPRRCCSSDARSPHSTDANTCVPTTSSASPCPCSRTGSPSRHRPGRRASTPSASWRA